MADEIEPYEIDSANAEKVKNWVAERGGLAVWGCLDLGNCGKQFMTPALDDEGKPYPKPHWSATNEPRMVITDLEKIMVATMEHFKTIRIALQRGSGLRIDLTKPSSVRLEKTLDAAGPGSDYFFEGWDGKDCVVRKRSSVVSLAAWVLVNNSTVVKEQSNAS